MAKRAVKVDWRNTAAGQLTYMQRRAEAQSKANETGFDHLLTKNDIFKDYMVSMLPQRENRFGRDLDGEVVMCENLARCQKGHGPVR